MEHELKKFMKNLTSKNELALLRAFLSKPNGITFQELKELTQIKGITGTRVRLAQKGLTFELKDNLWFITKVGAKGEGRVITPKFPRPKPRPNKLLNQVFR